MKNKLLLNTSLLSLGLFIGRVSGYLRELIIAYQFKVSSKADLIILLLAIPDIANNLISAGVLNNVFLPGLSKEENKKSFLGICILKSFSLHVIFYFLMLIYCYISFDRDTFYLCIIALLSIFPNAISSVLVMFLTYKEKFAFQSLGTLFFNSVLVIFLITAELTIWIAWGIFAAASIRMLLNYYKCHKEGFSWEFKSSGFKKVFLGLKALFLAIFANGLMYINPIVDKIVSKDLKAGSVALLSFAEKLYMLPVSILLTSIAVTSYPHMVKLVNEKKWLELKEFKKGLLLKTLGAGFLVMLTYVFLGDLLVKLVYGIAGLREVDYELVTNVLKYYSVAIFLSGGLALSINTIFAFQKYSHVAILSIIAVVFNFLGDKAIIGAGMDVKYIAGITSLTSIITFIIAFFIGIKLIKDASAKEL